LLADANVFGFIRRQCEGEFGGARTPDGRTKTNSVIASRTIDIKGLVILEIAESLTIQVNSVDRPNSVKRIRSIEKNATAARRKWWKMAGSLIVSLFSE